MTSTKSFFEEIIAVVSRYFDLIPKHLKRLTFQAPRDVTTAERLLHLQQERRKTFGADLFADPVWDMLLDLYVSSCRSRSVSVSSLCIASNVPPTTALRWITTMERRQLIVRESDPSDKRRYWLKLSPDSLDRLSALLNTIGISSGDEGSIEIAMDR